jgi:Holliday junction resolvasome RuvABC endonuclease subunit
LNKSKETSCNFFAQAGYAIYKNGEILSGVKKLRHDRNACGVRFLDFYRWLTEMIETHNIYNVFFERVYRHKGTEAAHVYGAFMYILVMVCEERHIKCTGIPVGTIKKFVTGKGNASKKDMINFAKNCGYNPADDNAADSLAILLTGLNMLKVQQNCGSCFDIKASGTTTPVNSLASEVF